MLLNNKLLIISFIKMHQYLRNTQKYNGPLLLYKKALCACTPQEHLITNL